MLALPAEQGVPVLDMRDELTVFQGLDNPNRWQGPFRGSPVRWKTPDGEAVVRALREAEANPVVRPSGRLATRRAGPTERHETTDGTVVVPEDDEGKTPEETGPAATTHTEIQYLLLKLGADMGFDVHEDYQKLNSKKYRPMAARKESRNVLSGRR